MPVTGWGDEANALAGPQYQVCCRASASVHDRPAVRPGGRRGVPHSLGAAPTDAADAAAQCSP